MVEPYRWAGLFEPALWWWACAPGLSTRFRLNPLRGAQVQDLVDLAIEFRVRLGNGILWSLAAIRRAGVCTSAFISSNLKAVSLISAQEPLDRCQR